MHTIVSTAGLPPRDAFEYWHDVSNAKLGSHTSKPHDRNNFYGELKVGDLTDLSVLTWKTSPLSGRIERNDDLVLLIPNCTGYIDSFAISPNVLCLLAQRSPLAYCSETELDQIGLRIPRAALQSRIPISDSITNQPIPLHGGGAMLADFLRSLTQIGPSTLSPAMKIVAREHALDLVALVLGNFAAVTPKLLSPERIAMVKLRMVIEDRLTDLTADRTSIAADVGFSERHVNRLLAQEGTSITELFRKRRLAKCREAIERSDRRINDIAREFGWTLSANFARDFKREFGLTPRQARLLIH